MSENPELMREVGKLVAMCLAIKTECCPFLNGEPTTCDWQGVVRNCYEMASALAPKIELNK